MPTIKRDHATLWPLLPERESLAADNEHFTAEWEAAMEELERAERDLG